MKACSICTEEYSGFGNNADPFPGRCCDRCNSMFVIPARIFRMQARKSKRGGYEIRRIKRGEWRLFLNGKRTAYSGDNFEEASKIKQHLEGAFPNG